MSRTVSNFENNIIDIYGKEGKEWLNSLPQLLESYTSKYQLSKLEPVSNMSFNYVAAGYQNDKSIILKLGINSKAIAKEARCLALYSDHGSVSLIAADDGAILMQRAVPGVTLKGHFPKNDNKAVHILCSKMKQLHSVTIPKQYNFYTLNELLNTLDNAVDIPSNILKKARHLRDQLLSTTSKIALLHGDLHHENILRNHDDWLSIDPKGFIGDPIFDACAFISNPIPELLEEQDPLQIINSRIDLCADLLNVSRQRVFDWHYVKSVLCWAWALEDNIDCSYFKKLIELINNEN